MAEPLDIVWSRPLPEGARPSTVTVSRDAAGRWFVSLLCEDTIEQTPAANDAVGVDMGVMSLVVLSTGEKVANPRHEQRDRARLTKAQRALSRKARGSANRDRARRRVARVHARITDRRRDFLHKLTSRLVRENQVVVIEDVAVGNMVKNRGLARAISDAAWRELRSMLEYKARWYGRDLVVVDRFFPSSKACSTPGCGYVHASLPLNVRTWACPSCGVAHDRDVNAALNLEAAGLAVVACGAGVRPQRESSRTGRPVTKQEGHGATRDEALASNHR
jgi:putative transposase